MNELNESRIASTLVTVELNNATVWQRQHDKDGNPGGITSSSEQELEIVRAALSESLEQIEGQLRLLTLIA